MKTTIPTSYRQGDVCLIAVKSIPADAAPQEPNGRKVILALGEATGHHHRFEFLDATQNVRLHVAHGGARYLHVETPAQLLHEEHSTVRVPAGDYVLPRQVEYTPAALRNVAD